jgi:hypothetical protein
MNNIKSHGLPGLSWLEEAKQAGPRKAVARLNEEENGFYAHGTRFDFNPRGCQAKIKDGRLLINYVGAGEPEGIRADGWLDVSEATGFVDAYARQIYAS